MSAALRSPPSLPLLVPGFVSSKRRLPHPGLYRRRTVIQRSASLISCFPFIHRGYACPPLPSVPIPRILHVAIVPGPPSLSFLLACSLERGRHLWGIGGDDFCYPSDDEKRKGNVECVPGLFFKEIESRSSE